MIHGKIRLVDFNNWTVRYYIETDSDDAEFILRAISKICDNKKFLRRAEKLLNSNSLNTGLTYTNPELRITIVVVSKSTDIWEFFNSLAHEIDHVEKHISRLIGFSPYSEDASYLVGEIIQEVFKDIVKNLIC